MSDPDGPEYRSRASLMRWLPITLFTTDGELRLHDGRLTFATSRREVFDAPVGELHSVARGATAGLYVWHGDRRLRFVTGNVSGRIGVSQPDSLLDVVASLPYIAGDLERDRTNRRHRDAWVDLLTPLVGDPPPGLRVPWPWPTWAWYVAIVGITLAIIAVVTAITLLTR